MENRDMLSKIRQSKWIKNNGTVLRAINTLRVKYVALTDLQYALEPEVTKPDITDSVHYLHESGYIQLRHIGTKEDTSLADTPYDELEAMLTADGIRLLAGKRTDDCIDI